MNNINSIIAIVKDELSIYDIGNVLDEDSMYRRVILALRAFGNDATEMHEDVVRIREGKGKLPDNFYSIYEARLCCPLNYDNHGHEVEVHHVMETQYYNLIHELKTSWNSCNDCCKEEEAKVYKKELIYKEGRKVTCRYEKGEHVRLVKGFVKNDCASECIRSGKDCHNEISVIQDQVHANFNEGDLYIRYRGFLVDEKGEMVLIDTPNRYLEQYLEYELKVKMAERLMANKEAAAGLSQLFPIWEQRRKDYRHNAVTELKLKSLQPRQLEKKIQAQNRYDYKRQSLPFRTRY